MKPLYAQDLQYPAVYPQIYSTGGTDLDQQYQYVDANIDLLPEEDKNAYIAAGKALSFLIKMENTGSCGLERSSVYGAAIAIPQIARSTGYCCTMTSFAIRSYLFLLINIFMQLFLLSMIGEEAHVMSAFAGRMHLCNFGSAIERCPDADAPNCKGPGGTTFSFPRLYDFSTWATRTFIRDSLIDIFPDRQEDIYNLADPGEYGMENYYCRLLCCFVFMMNVMEDFRTTLDVFWLLIHIPTAPQKWIRYEKPDWGEKDHVKSVHAWRELDLVKFGVAGMPAKWKVANFLFIVVPKFLIWVVLAVSGNYFLMETAGITDVIMNSVALTFILNIDEMIFACFTTVSVRHIMSRMEEYELFSVEAEEAETDDEVLHRFHREEFGPGSWCIFLKRLNPKRLINVVIFMAIFNISYYYASCEQRADGSWTSKPIYMPTNVTFNPVAWVLPIPAFGWHQSSEPSWTMPE